MAVERLDRGVDIENPWLAQQRPDRLVEMAGQPARPRVGFDLVQAAPHRILTHHPLHAQQRRVHGVAPQRRDVRVPPLTGQDRQHRRPQHVALRGRVRAGVDQRTGRYQGVEPTAQLQVFRKERQVSERRHRRIRVPFDLNRTSVGIDHHRPRVNIPLNAG